MIIKPISEKECEDLLSRASLARLGCSLENQPYVVPVYISYEANHVYVFSTHGKKVEWLRANPRVCVQADEIAGRTEWVSVIANGEYQELSEPRFSAERAHARELLESRNEWWLNAMAERREEVPDASIAPVFFRIRIDSMTGLRGSAKGL
jgi:nitroimidazol reductase NimA-like FMN-containing flavoprotein (pyridoxamine 5'-phosphate oxidase superfamily)